MIYAETLRSWISASFADCGNASTVRHAVWTSVCKQSLEDLNPVDHSHPVRRIAFGSTLRMILTRRPACVCLEGGSID
jgi:hypothetical protein